MISLLCDFSMKALFAVAHQLRAKMGDKLKRLDLEVACRAIIVATTDCDQCDDGVCEPNVHLYVVQEVEDWMTLLGAQFSPTLSSHSMEALVHVDFDIMIIMPSRTFLLTHSKLCVFSARYSLLDDNALCETDDHGLLLEKIRVAMEKCSVSCSGCGKVCSPNMHVVDPKSVSPLPAPMDIHIPTSSLATNLPVPDV